MTEYGTENDTRLGLGLTVDRNWGWKWTEINNQTRNWNGIEKDTRNVPVTKTGTEIETGTDIQTGTGYRDMIEKYSVEMPTDQNQY